MTNNVNDEYKSLKYKITNNSLLIINTISQKLDEYTKYKVEYDRLNGIFNKDVAPSIKNVQYLIDKYIKFFKNISETDIIYVDIDNYINQLINIYNGFLNMNNTKTFSNKVEKLENILKMNITIQKIKAFFKFIDDELSNKNYGDKAHEVLLRKTLIILCDFKDEIIHKMHKRGNDFIQLAHNICAIQNNNIVLDLPVKQNSIKKIEDLFLNLNFDDNELLQQLQNYNSCINIMKENKEKNINSKMKNEPKPIDVVTRKQRMEEHAKLRSQNNDVILEEKTKKKEVEIPENVKRYLESYMPIILNDEYDINLGLPVKETPNYELIINQMLIEVQKVIDDELASNILIKKRDALEDIAKNMYKN